MEVVIASGKGGTGKTLVATSLALVAAEIGRSSVLDADVEAPNAALFLDPALDSRHPVALRIPVVDAEACTHCGRCGEVCQYHAIAALPKETMVFPQLCHGCGSCTLMCPEGAISESPREIGWIDSGSVSSAETVVQPIRFAQGTLEIGEAMATPVIRALKGFARDQGWYGDDYVIVDAPPGTACPVIEALRGADVALLVTEPTPFGLHDLAMAVDVARDALRLPVGIVLNKDGAQGTGNPSDVEDYCHEQGLPILMRIPLDRDIAVAYSTGVPLVRSHPAYWQDFVSLLRILDGLAERRVA